MKMRTNNQFNGNSVGEGVVQERVLKLRWFDAPGSSSAVPWSSLAMILATLFLNFWFWLAIGWDFPFAGPPLLYFSLLVGVAVLLVALFYIGPAFSVPSGRSLFDAA